MILKTDVSRKKTILILLCQWSLPLPPPIIAHFLFFKRLNEQSDARSNHLDLIRTF